MSAVPKGDDPFGLDCKGVTPHASNVETFWVIGHRGAAGKAVENTINAMQQGVEAGANAVEIDLSLTKDRVVVLWHDWDPDNEVAVGRQSGKEGGVAYRPRVPAVDDPMRKRVSDLTLDELRANYGYADKDGNKVDAQIPTFDDFAQWALGEPRLAGVFLDLKVPEDEAALVDPIYEKILAALPADKRKLEIVVSTPQQAVWDRLQTRQSERFLALEVDPALVIVDTSDCGSSSSAKGGRGENAVASTVQPLGLSLEAFNALKSRLECDLKARDERHTVKKVLAATLNDKEKLGCLVDLGVDGIVTDDPFQLRNLVKEKGRK